MSDERKLTSDAPFAGRCRRGDRIAGRWSRRHVFADAEVLRLRSAQAGHRGSGKRTVDGEDAAIERRGNAPSNAPDVPLPDAVVTLSLETVKRAGIEVVPV